MSKKKSDRQETDGTKPAAKDSVQEKYVQMQMIDQQSKQLQKYLQMFDQQLLEVRGLINSVKEFSQLKKGDNILAPIANGVFVKAKLEDSKELLINVGSGVVANKTIAEALKLLEGQEAELVQYRSETMANLEELMRQAEGMQ